VVWVTSGAIATARQQIHHGWKTLPEKQALSAVGQPALMELYNTALQFHGLRGGQVLLSYADFKGKVSRKNLTNTLHQLLDWDCVPVLNENDAVATDEIQFGDNDMLSALVATEIKADQLVILTNVEGLYDRDPAIPGAQLISELKQVPESLLKKLKTASLSSSGRGGIYSKLKAARYAQKKGVSTVIIRGDRFNVLNDLAEGQKIGTRVLV
jgi:glutamate 5-kinase